MSRRVWTAAALTAAAGLTFASVQTTGALWRDSEAVPGSTIRAGSLSLSAGAGSGSTYTFAALAKNPVVADQAVQAPLTITNTGTAPLRFRLTNGGPAVTGTTSAGTTGGVTVSLAGAVVTGAAACTPTTGMGSAFPTFTATAPTQAVAGVWQRLDRGASQTWCIRTTLTAAPTTGSVTYQHRFSFAVEQVR
ncbi:MULTISPECIES: hypothetical protein [Nocardiaceae]|uniref:SipW-cognate class signal peptide n=1 Tax=Rhodococcoides kroppenstedtii TaxID=293050 RepID=A0ABS7NSB1_9NOCA|nr:MULTISPECIES: hypothetical protein [Rhodococcus]AMY17930.1 hypothetical protein A3Q40_00521 [Rhodococcus sp. PBTS 1]MBY6313197.1 hypothetical protein [Rhodococcus kroppenstedtii]MBY6320884.1 hypothetical protein [Rhodococcus kroppenstedtii]MBY6399787.1 hypothetical protein [Rhodococcus kroppenstedtii]